MWLGSPPFISQKRLEGERCPRRRKLTTDDPPTGQANVFLFSGETMRLNIFSMRIEKIKNLYIFYFITGTSHMYFIVFCIHHVFFC